MVHRGSGSVLPGDRAQASGAGGIVPEPLFTRLYPDIAAHGSLAVAVRDLAATHGLDLGSVRPAPEPGWVLCGAVLESAAGKVSLLLGSEDRVVMVTCWRRGVALASGSAPELLPVARAAEAFLRGDSLADLRDHHTFMRVRDLAFAFDAGTEVEAMWQLMMAHLEFPMPSHPHGEGYDATARRMWREYVDREARIRRMALAAAEQPALRMLFPFTSHWVLCFSRCTGYPYTWDLPKIEPAGAGSYRVWDGGTNPNLSGGRLLADGVDVREAVAAVVAALPDNCGPAIAGTADDLDR
jgi:Family of unknown function (DUF6193)